MSESEGRWRCAIGLHKWSKWRDVAEGTIKTTYHGHTVPVVTGRWIDQERRCTRCGKVQLRTERDEI